jgi:hypothetical protein
MRGPIVYEDQINFPHWSPQMTKWQLQEVIGVENGGGQVPHHTEGRQHTLITPGGRLQLFEQIPL